MKNTIVNVNDFHVQLLDETGAQVGTVKKHIGHTFRPTKLWTVRSMIGPVFKWKGKKSDVLYTNSKEDAVYWLRVIGEAKDERDGKASH